MKGTFDNHFTPTADPLFVRCRKDSPLRDHMPAYDRDSKNPIEKILIDEANRIWEQTNREDLPRIAASYWDPDSGMDPGIFTYLRLAAKLVLNGNSL